MNRNDAKKTGFSSRLALIGITLVVILLALSIEVRSRDLRQQMERYTVREEKLDREIHEEEERTEDLLERKKYVSTLEYYKKVAREKLGLIDKDEVLLKENQ